MKYINFIASLFFLALLTGCGSASSEKTAAKTEDTAAVVQTSIPATSDTNSTVTTTPVTTTPTMPAVTSPTKTVTIGSPQPVTISPATTAGLNPEHGKPGHRCDIGVGVPLNSKPAATTAVAPQPTISSTPPTITNVKTPVINTTPAKTTTATATGPNPEHGKPGHRCDIGVGEPLDSKPAATVSTQPAATVSTPVINTTAPAAGTNVAGGLNPEHGKPGHRCDISVGAPLDSKPKQ